MNPKDENVLASLGVQHIQQRAGHLVGGLKYQNIGPETYFLEAQIDGVLRQFVEAVRPRYLLRSIRESAGYRIQGSAGDGIDA